MNAMIETTKGQHVYTPDVLRSIAKLVRRLGKPELGDGGGYAGIKGRAEALACKVEALATSVALAEGGMPDMQRQAEAEARELMEP